MPKGLVPETHFKVQIRQGKVKAILVFSFRRKLSVEQRETILMGFESWVAEQLK